MEYRMDKVFGKMKENNEKILILYFPIGDSIFEGKDVEWAKKYFDNGCTVLEIGLPYENPIYDGNTVKSSMQRALERTNVDEVLKTIGEIRKACPENVLQIMCYYEIVDRYGIEKFAQLAKEAGVDGVLSPNVPSDKVKEIHQTLEDNGIYFLEFAPFNLTSEAIQVLKDNVKGGYVFQQAVDGATGEQPSVNPQVRENVRILHEEKIPAAICPGFGISNANQAAEVIGMGGDGLIIGSATINHVIKGDAVEFIKGVSDAMKEAAAK